MKFNYLLFAGLLLCSARGYAQDYPVRSVSFTDVQVQDKFWAPRLEVNRTVTLPYDLDKYKGKKGASDLYKVIEGASYILMTRKDAKLEAYLDTLIAGIAAMQQPDGYLLSRNSVAGAERWYGKDDDGEEGGAPELYMSGHLFESAVAHYQATGKKNFLDIATKNADLLVKTFGPGKLTKYPSHPEVELALVKLYRATKKKSYLDLAKFLLDTRGPNGKAYSQADRKIVDQHEAEGHAVRALYLYSGVTDIAALKNDKAYKKAIEDIWTDAVTKKMYVTGGVGSLTHWEAFGDPYKLQNMTAYSETCASIANVLWNDRMFLMNADAKYIDVLERILYNAVLSGISLSGDRFYYPNPLASVGQYQRASWYGVPCCPTNIVRFLPQVPGLIYAHQNNDLYVNLFMTNTGTVDLPAGKVEISQTTEYPWEGGLSIGIDPAKQSSFTLRIRIPGWAQDQPVPGDLYRYTDNQKTAIPIAINGKQVEYKIEKGYAVIKRKWSKGDKVTLELPMTARKLVANENVKDDNGRVALQRGPIVYCLEWADNASGNVQNKMIDPSAALKAVFNPAQLKGIVEITAPGTYYTRNAATNALTKKNVEVKAIPYYAWANRGAGEMAVWIPSNESVAAPQPLIPANFATGSRILSSHPTELLGGLNDRRLIPYEENVPISNYYRWPLTDSVQWVQYNFKKSEKVSSVNVYWYDNEPFKMITWYDDMPWSCARVPDSWQLYYRNDLGKWEPVKAKGAYPTERGKYNKLEFEPVNTTSLRMVVQRNKDFATGILEWTAE